MAGPFRVATPKGFIISCVLSSMPNTGTFRVGCTAFAEGMGERSGVGEGAAPPLAGRRYLFPFARLWVTHSISQFLAELSPPLLHAATWSASISSNL